MHMPTLIERPELLLGHANRRGCGYHLGETDCLCSKWATRYPISKQYRSTHEQLLQHSLEKPGESAEALVKQVCFILNDQGWKRIAEDLAPFLVGGSERLTIVYRRTFLQLRPRRHHKTARHRFPPSSESEHTHDPVDRGGMLADECEFVDDAEKNGRGVTVNVPVNDQERER